MSKKKKNGNQNVLPNVLLVTAIIELISGLVELVNKLIE